MSEKKIEKQESGGDIYNVLGDFNNNGGTLQIETLILENSSGVENALFKSEQKKLVASYSTSYLDFLKKQFQTKTLIERTLVNEIWQKLSTVSQLLLTGNPGSGKTCALFQLSSLAPEAIYISIRKRSILGVVNHLINKIRIKQQDTLLSTSDPEEAVEILQGLLQGSEMVFFIDDCEAEPSIASRLISLHKASNRFIFASRDTTSFESTGIGAFPVTAFSEEETKDFLARNDIVLDLLSFSELYRASWGNALYLFYFSKYQIRPLPIDVVTYHKAIWADLSPEEQECLIYIWLSYRGLRINDLSRVTGDVRLTDTTQRISRLASLINNEEGRLQIFHPAFTEYVLERIRQEGLSTAYSEKLGNYLLEQKRLVAAAWLLIDSQPGKVNEFGLEAMSAVIITGDLHFAVKLILTLLQYKRPRLEEGYLEYHLSCVYRFLHQETLCVHHLQKAITLFKKVKDKTWLLAAEMVKAMNLVEEGKNSEGLALADSIFERAEKYGDRFKGRNLVNLSKIYVDLSEYKKGAKASKEAFDLFEKLNDREGMVSSLANLASCLAKLEDYSDLAETYAKKLLEVTHSAVGFTVKLIALNILTSINRQKQRYAEAKKYGWKAVTLCQQYDLPDKLILNLINYGNIIRDEEDITGAKAVYEEALVHAKELGLKKEEGRINRILASIYYDLDELDKSIDFSDRSIAACKQVSYQYGVAHALEEKAKALATKEEKLAAAAAYEESARIFLTIENFSKDTKSSFAKAIQYYFEAGAVDKANNLISLFITDVPNNDATAIEQLVSNPADANVKDNIHESFQKLAAKYGEADFNQNTIRKFLVYLDYCHKNTKTAIKGYYQVLATLTECLTTNRFALTTLGILVEQSRTLLDAESLLMLFAVLEKKIPGFYYRETYEEAILLASVTTDLKVEIHISKDDLLGRKLALTAALFFFAAPELVSSEKKSVESFYRFWIVNLLELTSSNNTLKIPESTFSQHSQTVMLSSRRPGVIDSVCINTEYQKAADLIIHPNNKCLMYFIGTLAMQMTSHFYKDKKGLNGNAHKYVPRKLAYFFNYTNIEEIDNLDKEFGINLEKINLESNGNKK
jgi:tetratricopeptide (TPR) repeat protein